MTSVKNINLFHQVPFEAADGGDPDPRRGDVQPSEGAGGREVRETRVGREADTELQRDVVHRAAAGLQSVAGVAQASQERRRRRRSDGHSSTGGDLKIAKMKAFFSFLQHLKNIFVLTSAVRAK